MNFKKFMAKAGTIVVMVPILGLTVVYTINYTKFGRRMLNNTTYINDTEHNTDFYRLNSFGQRAYADYKRDGILDAVCEISNVDPHGFYVRQDCYILNPDILSVLPYDCAKTIDKDSDKAKNFQKDFKTVRNEYLALR